MVDGKAAVGVLLAALGSIVVVAGTGPVLDGVRWLVARAGLLVLGAAAAWAVYRAVPADQRKGPFVLAAAGAAVLLMQRGATPSTVMGGIVVGLGALLAALRPGGVFRDDVDPVHTYRRIGYARRIAARQSSSMPKQIRLLAVLTVVQIDLSEARPGPDPFVELVLTGWFTIIRITLPAPWAAVAGRVAATRGVAFRGDLDSPHPFTDLEDDTQQQRLGAVKRAAITDTPAGQDETIVRVVIHMAGAASRVVLVGR